MVVTQDDHREDFLQQLGLISYHPDAEHWEDNVPWSEQLVELGAQLREEMTLLREDLLAEVRGTMQEEIDRLRADLWQLLQLPVQEQQQQQQQQQPQQEEPQQEKDQQQQQHQSETEPSHRGANNEPENQQGQS